MNKQRNGTGFYFVPVILVVLLLFYMLNSMERGSSLSYQAFRDNAVVSLAMAGMLCGVAAVILDVVIDMAKTLLQKKRLLPLLVLLGAFCAVRFFAVNIILVILACGLLGAVDTLMRGKKAGEGVCA